jgi:hypothetical protein
LLKFGVVEFAEMVSGVCVRCAPHTAAPRSGETGSG